MPDIFDVAICTIFAREFMEGAIIIGEFRTVIQRSEVPEDQPGVPTKAQMLRAVSVWAFLAALVAVVMILIVSIPLAVLSKEFDEKTATIIEGISKVVAAVCIIQLSLKIPKWMGFYKTKKTGKVSKDSFDLTMSSIRFNVAWNVWREVAECGVFLLPFFLNHENLPAVPISALVGIVVGLAVGFFVYWANKAMAKKVYVAIFVTLVLVFLSTGLFVGGCHEFEEIAHEETANVWNIHGEFWDHHNLPMAILKPFGYSSTRSVLQITTFWLWLTLAAGLHFWKVHQTKRITAEQQAAAADLKLNGSCDNNDVTTNAVDVEKGAAHSPENSDDGEEIARA